MKKRIHTILICANLVAKPDHEYRLDAAYHESIYPNDQSFSPNQYVALNERSRIFQGEVHRILGKGPYRVEFVTFVAAQHELVMVTNRKGGAMVIPGEYLQPFTLTAPTVKLRHLLKRLIKRSKR